MAQKDASFQALRLGRQGRIVIPAAVRRALRIEPGYILVAWREEDRLVLRPKRAVEEELWALFEGVEESLASDLLRERRQAGARESQS